VRVVTSRLLYPLLFRIRSTPGLGGALDDDVALPDGRRTIYWLGSTAAEAVWTQQGRAPLLRLDREHDERGRAALRALGVPDNAWFICLHAREPGYLRETGESYARHLNVDVGTYAKAVETVTSRGGWVIRMGDPTMTPLKAMPNVVDYAHSPAKSDWLDVFLAARCRFWLGSNSGIYFLAESFGTPVAMTNLVPNAYRMWGPRTVIILKLYHSDRADRLLTFGEALAPEILHLQDLDDHGIRVVDNTPEEIDELVVEMLARLDGAAEYTDADEERRRRYDSLTPYYPYGIDSRIGRDFLRRHEGLLSPPFVADPSGPLPLRIPRAGRRAHAAT
jgi:putative glycosyltransferase (TIGR04372 family)